MPKIEYIPKRFSAGSMALIDICNGIIDEYDAMGFDLTLRQVYYQCVSRGHIANKQSEYKRLGSILNDARLAGLIDWDKIEDRTRNVRGLSHWETPADIIKLTSEQFRVDLWAGQANYVECWIEKDALVGVVERICNTNDISYFSCRGYTSQSEVWGAAMRFIHWDRKGRSGHIIHLGDHDPSGIDMTRDIQARMNLFCNHHDAEPVEVHRIALNMDQVEEYDPPPNPAKMTDSRSTGYVDLYGKKSWELDALDPTVIASLIQSQIDGLVDIKKYRKREKIQEEGRKQLARISDQWESVVDGLN